MADKKESKSAARPVNKFTINPTVLLMDLKDIAAMFWAVIRGKYPMPKRSLIWFFIGVIYFLLPLDFVPEIFFAVLGFTDDILVLVFVINKMRPDIEDYRAFREKKDKIKYEKSN